MKQMAFIRLSILGSLFCLNLAQAGEVAKPVLIGSSGSEQVQLLELFSSESCSSCPPADQWISKLKQDSKLWKKFVPVVFHVDYWNNLGWVDKYSSQQMTQRQVEIAKLWSRPNVYTPAMVLNGKEWQGWRSSSGLENSAEASKKAITLSVYKSGENEFLVKAENLKTSHKYVIRVAKLGMDLSTKVQSGENSGSVLTHNFLVLDWDSKTINADKTSLEQTIQLKSKNQNSAKTAVAVWIEDENIPVALQATGGFL